MAYDPHQSLTQPARERAELWRLVLGLSVGTAIYFGLALFAIAAFASVFPLFDDRGDFAATPGTLLFFLGSFALMVLALEFTTRTLHKRPALSYVGSPPHAVRDFFRVLIATMPLMLGLSFLMGLSVETRLNSPPGLWALLLPVSVALLIVQVTAEELVFRGYLQSQLAARFGAPLIWMILPSLLFAYGHYDPGEAGSNALAIAFWTFAFGIAAADLTARTGTLGAAIALHLTNNFVALLVLSIDGSLSGLSLFSLKLTLADEAAIRPLLWVDGLTLVCLYLAARIGLRV